MERQIIAWSLPSQKNKIVKWYPKAWRNCNLPLRFKFCVTETLKFLSYAVTESPALRNAYRAYHLTLA